MRNNKQGDVAVVPGLNFIFLILHGCPLVELWGQGVDG